MAMSSLKISIFVLAVSCSMVVINSTGVMEPHTAPNISALEGVHNQVDDITKLDNGMSSDEVISDQLFGITGFLAELGMLKTMLQLVFVPGPYLLANGVNPYIAWFIQILFNTSFALGILQILFKWGFSGTTV